MNNGNSKAKLNDITQDKNDILVSFDVTSLFTNVHSQTIILEILNFCLIDNNYFNLNDKTYTIGMPVGNTLYFFFQIQW